VVVVEDVEVVVVDDVVVVGLVVVVGGGDPPRARSAASSASRTATPELPHRPKSLSNKLHDGVVAAAVGTVGGAGSAHSPSRLARTVSPPHAGGGKDDEASSPRGGGIEGACGDPGAPTVTRVRARRRKTPPMGATTRRQRLPRRTWRAAVLARACRGREPRA
jgi:hypothetical protein